MKVLKMFVFVGGHIHRVFVVTSKYFERCIETKGNKNCTNFVSNSIFGHGPQHEDSIVVVLIEPPRGKTNNMVSEQVRHKPACTSIEKS